MIMVMASDSGVKHVLRARLLPANTARQFAGQVAEGIVHNFVYLQIYVDAHFVFSFET